MAKINLRDLFPNDYDFNCYITVPDGMADAFILNMTKEIADIYVESHRAEAAYIRNRSRNKAFYSTDSEEWLMNECGGLTDDPFDEQNARFTKNHLHAAISKLPDKQAKRVYAYYFLGMNFAEIARSEGVNESKVRKAIERGLESLKKYFKNISE